MLYLASGYNKSQARFSPDGRLVAYTSDESGENEVYIQTFPEASEKWTISKGGGNQPHWRRDGKELFYVSADSRMMAVDVTPTPVFAHGNPKALFRVPIWGGATSLNVTRYDARRAKIPDQHAAGGCRRFSLANHGRAELGS